MTMLWTPATACFLANTCQGGMVSFSNFLTEADVEAIHHYVLKKQSELYNQQKDKRQPRTRAISLIADTNRGGGNVFLPKPGLYDFYPLAYM